VERRTYGRIGLLLACGWISSAGCTREQEQPAPDAGVRQNEDTAARQLGLLLVDAARHGDRPRVDLLLARGADPGARDGRGDTAVLAFFSRRNWRLDTGLLHALQAHGARLDDRDRLGRTPLHLAALRGRRDLVGYLIERGARADVRDTRGVTPLHLAAESGAPRVVMRLLTAGVPIDGRDRQGRTPLHWAGRENQREIGLLLVSLGADVEAHGRNGRSPLGWLAGVCLDELREAAGELGESICASHRALGPAVLHHAAVAGETMLASRLLQAGVDPGRPGTYHPALGVAGTTALHAAARGGHLELARQLIERGARLDARDANGWTPLHWAAWKGRARAAEMLLAHGAAPSARTRNGKRPRDLVPKIHSEAMNTLFARYEQGAPGRRPGRH